MGPSCLSLVPAMRSPSFPDHKSWWSFFKTWWQMPNAVDAQCPGPWCNCKWRGIQRQNVRISHCSGIQNLHSVEVFLEEYLKQSAFNAFNGRWLDSLIFPNLRGRTESRVLRSSSWQNIHNIPTKWAPSPVINGVRILWNMSIAPVTHLLDFIGPFKGGLNTIYNWKGPWLVSKFDSRANDFSSLKLTASSPLKIKAIGRWHVHLGTFRKGVNQEEGGKSNWGGNPWVDPNNLCLDSGSLVRAVYMTKGGYTPED